MKDKNNELLNVPYDLEAEKNVLACILLDNDVIVRVLDVLSVEDFYDPFNRLIFHEIIELYRNYKAVDVASLRSELSKEKRSKNDRSRINLDYINSIITDSIVVISNVETYASTVKECSIRRKIISMSARLAKMALEETRRLDDILDDIESEVFSISMEKFYKQSVSSIKNLAVNIFEKFTSGDDVKASSVGLDTGFTDLDKIIGGLRKGDLIIIAARPSVGKTAFMLEIARHLSVDLKKKVLIFSLEMSDVQIAERLISLQSEIPLQNIVMGYLEEKDLYKLTEDIVPLYDSEIFIDDTPGLTISEIKTRSRKLYLDEGLDAIFVDYLQLLRARKKNNEVETQRVQEVSEISQGLKNMARELNLPVIALSQLNRAVEMRPNKRPQLSDLRESGSIEQDADIVIFLHRSREAEGDNGDSGLKNKSEVIVSKNRNGPTGIVKLRFIDYCAKFKN